MNLLDWRQMDLRQMDLWQRIDSTTWPDVTWAEYNLLRKQVRLHDVKCFDMYKIDASGQCFTIYPVRAEDEPYRRYLVLHKGHAVMMGQQGSTVTFECSLMDFDQVWVPFFDLTTDYSNEQSLMLLTTQGQLFKVADQCGGIRILRQDPWEALLQFMMSSANNIPRIRQLVKAIADEYGCVPGERVHLSYQYKCLPSWITLQNKGLNAAHLEAGLRRLGCGYRARYVAELFARFQEPEWEQFINHTGDAEPGQFHKWLTSLNGVGDKIASCVELYGLHDLQAYPVDTWMEKIHTKYFNGKRPDPPYEGAPMGLIQMYLYYWERAYAPD